MAQIQYDAKDEIRTSRQGMCRYIYHPPHPVNHNPSFPDADARSDGEVVGMR